MRTYNFNLKALILILALTLAGHSYAHKDFDNTEEKKVVKINMKAPLIKFITSNLDIDSQDIEILKEQLKEANFYLLNGDNMEFEVSLIEAESSDAIILIEYGNEDTPVIEDWMLEDDYLNTESTPVIEDWMLEDDYLSTEATPVIEDWMLEDDYLNTEATPVIEDWMLNGDYLSSENTPLIEDWMISQD